MRTLEHATRKRLWRLRTPEALSINRRKHSAEIIGALDRVWNRQRRYCAPSVTCGGDTAIDHRAGRKRACTVVDEDDGACIRKGCESGDDGVASLLTADNERQRAAGDLGEPRRWRSGVRWRKHDNDVRNVRVCSEWANGVQQDR